MFRQIYNNGSRSVDYFKIAISVLATFYFLYYAETAKDWHFIDNFNLIIHEAGHSIFFFLGDFVQVIAGSLFQILVPVTFVVYFYVKENYLSSSLLLFWVGQSIVNVSVYVSDAILMQLPLLGGENSIHDWNYILNSLGVIRYTKILGSLTFDIGVLFILLASYFSIVASYKKHHL